MSTSFTEIERACRRLVQQFALYVDNRQSAAVAGLFTPDGIFERGGGIHRGAEAIQALVETRPPDIATFHVMSNILVEPDGQGGAQAISSFQFYRWTMRDPSPAVPAVLGYYQDQFANTADGWRIARRTVRVLLGQ